MLDTGSSQLVIPKSCLNNTYKVIEEDVVDVWNSKVDLMQGDLSFKTQQNEMLTVKDQFFYAIKKDNNGWEIICEASGDVRRAVLGAFPRPGDKYDNLFLSIAKSTKYKYFEINPGSTPQLKFYQEWPQGYRRIKLENNAKLSPWPVAGGFKVQVSGATISDNVGKTPLVASGKYGMIDTGGGMTIIQDDDLYSSIKENEMSRECGQTWVSECACIQAGLDVEVSIDQTNVKYCFKASSETNNNNNNVAVCPSSAKHIPANTGINPGINLFLNNKVIFDPIGRNVGILPTTSTCN